MASHGLAEARRLLLAASSPVKTRLERHLLVAAAIDVATGGGAVVVGGVAQDWWVGDHYRPTDLDLCRTLTPAVETTLEQLGFLRQGRHWYCEQAEVAVEFPESYVAGDPERFKSLTIEGVQLTLIGVDDLYLDRLRQATASPGDGSIEFMSTLAIAAARYDDIDWKYVHREIAREQGLLGEDLKKLNRKIQRRARVAAAKADNLSS